MPRTGKATVNRSFWVVLGLCVASAGCSAGREAMAADGTGASGHGVPLAGVAGHPRLGGEGTLAEQQLAGPPAWSPGVADHLGGLTRPNEAEKVAHAPYVIEPPDTLLIDAVRLIPLPPYKVEPLDALAILVTNTLPKAPIEGIYAVDPSGAVDLGFTYGSVMVHGKTLKEVKQIVEDNLKEKLKPPYEVYVSLAQSRAMQQIRGEHLVRQDGTIGLGTYGSVYITGMTIAQAKSAIENHLSQFLFQPKVSLDVSGFNSHVYFIIFDYPGTGQQVQRLPITGNETVLDALGGFTVRGLPAGVSKRRIWVARPGPAKSGHNQILPVDWTAITRNGSTATNYQLLPGDRIYVAQDPLASLDIFLARVFAPLERAFGITLLGNSVIQNLTNSNGTGGAGGTR